VRRFLVVPGLAWIFAVLWALHYVGVRNEWLWAGRWLLLSLLALVAFVAWLREKLRERRADNALESQRSPSRSA
jgi:cyanate permease